MAKILYEVKKNQNSHSAAFGKWYAQIKNLETLNTRKLANHISWNPFGIPRHYVRIGYYK